MAEFKLGRIRFIWKGGWTPATAFYKDDIVRYGGNTYLCIVGNTSTSNFDIDLSSYWNKISDGQEWKSDWAINTLYKANDIVKYGGYLYIVNTQHTSAANITLGLEADQSKWDLFAEGFDWKSDWNISTRYKVNDIAKYDGLVYICLTGHTSAANITLGLEPDQAKWEIFSEGLEWKTDWAAATRYRVNDIVKYSGTLYIANTGHTSAANITLGLEPDQAKWDYLHKGIEYQGTFAGTTRYRVNDIVKSGGGLWICVTPHTSQTTLEQDESKWSEFVSGLEFEDSWLVGTNYDIGDIVTFGGYTYVSKTTNIGQLPTTATSDWDLFNTGFRHVGEYATATAAVAGTTVSTTALVLDTNSGTIVQGMVVTGTGIVGTVTVTTVTDQNNLVLSSAQSLTNDVVLSFNTAYLVGDVVRLGGYTYLAIANATGQRPPNPTFWERLNQGIEWKNTWTNATLYDVGDAVRYGDNSYICVLGHTSDQVTLTNRPDQDTGGVNWNVVASGAEVNVLTTAGDIVYTSGSGPARLPIGTLGQVLRVNSAGNAPEWASFGKLNNIFYVESTTGVDALAPIYGSTLDRPWKTVRYATEQVQSGPNNYNTRTLLERNRSYIQDEIVEWIDAQVVIGTGIWSGFTYVQETCRRDMGILIDALVWDLSHGGNERSRLAALAYFTGGGASYVAGQEGQTVAAINYGVTVIDAVISNLVPAAVYGTLNRYTNAALTEESGTQATIAALLAITTDAITAAVITGIPAELKSQTTIYIKTGTLTEVLPIIVPENTAIIGDELRSTRIVAAGSLVAAADTPYSLAAITRLAAVMSDIVTNSAVTISTGNAVAQVTTAPAGSSAAGSAAAATVTDIKEYIDFKINAAGTEPTLAGTITPNTTTGYTYAVETIEANRAFLVAEILAYIAVTYPSYTYDTAACSRDVNRYLDAIKYDLIYTGNYKSLLYARYYTNAVSGSTTEDMFYLRNGTGLRNCTITGLLGTLGSANAYGTKRTSAGAFVSLDPGFGPAHTAAWIINKSPYVQNVTTFGTGCIGLKVDGDLHAGGNDSIVANDFTQVISDGIGAWVTNLGRAELVSVFSYYGHIGYLAENGGKIRATNGNSSYGEFGTVAEGVDATETAITGTVTNRAFEAIVKNVLTDGNNILAFEYANAGVGYTAGATTYTVTGEGFGAAINSPVTVDGGVYEVRLLDIVGATEGLFGGSGYINAQNTGQEGTTTQLTISNTDTRTSASYVGMAIRIISGTGTGQYAYIDTYNSGSKVATVKKMSDDSAGWDHITGVAIAAVLTDTTEYSIEPRITFTAPTSGLYADTTKARAIVVDEKISEIRIFDPGNGYNSIPTMTITDPNNVQVGSPAVDLPHLVRIGDGVLTQPTWTNRGTNFTTAQAELTGDGYADLYQPGSFLQVAGLSLVPQAGANIEIVSLTGQIFKLVNVRNLTGSGPYAAQLQISPNMSITDAPEHAETFEIRIRYSQVRLTGHDFLDIGTGNFANTNYPGIPVINPDSTKETNDFGGGRVFYTSTDQDGNFRVGGLFSIEQATGIATLNADAFNISGLQELQLGAISLGGTNAAINEFSTDGTFTADSDNIVPTQKAIKTYIQSQIGGGAGELNVNKLTAGQIELTSNTITNTLGATINILSKTNFTGGIDGDPVAMNFFLT
jgi:hypothetical protein